MIDGQNFDVNIMDYKINPAHYQSPVLWMNLCGNRNNLYDPFKNDVFSAGLILLECCIIDNDYTNNINVENLRKRIHLRNGEMDYYFIFAAMQYVAGKYPEIPVLYEALHRMLCENELQRIDWVRLLQCLPARNEIQRHLDKIPLGQTPIAMSSVFSNNWSTINPWRSHEPLFTQPMPGMFPNDQSRVSSQSFMHIGGSEMRDSMMPNIQNKPERFQNHGIQHENHDTTYTDGYNGNFGFNKKQNESIVVSSPRRSKDNVVRVSQTKGKSVHFQEQGSNIYYPKQEHNVSHVVSNNESYHGGNRIVRQSEPTFTYPNTQNSQRLSNSSY